MLHAPIKPSLDIVEQLQITVIPCQALAGITREKYSNWIVESNTPRKERAQGDTLPEAIMALLEKLKLT